MLIISETYLNKLNQDPLAVNILTTNSTDREGLSQTNKARSFKWLTIVFVSPRPWSPGGSLNENTWVKPH